MHADAKGEINYCSHSREATDPYVSFTEQNLNGCIPIPKVAPVETAYAHEAQNVSDQARAEIYSDDNCESTKTVPKVNERAPDKVHFRTVKFAPTSTG
ncbi:hypothetical protein [Streptomyces sp. XH2]|uniref:hypothetical protein n=1 Tax=Streptomyces sp. XH2 TaxID=3412483 RepID=UPI003C7CDE5A